MSEVDAQIEEWLLLYGGESVVLGDLLCDRHSVADAAALLYETHGSQSELTYEALGQQSSRLAGALASEGVGRGDRVGVLLPRSPELLIALLAIWRLGAVEVPLFTAFGPEAVSYRLEHSQARALITDTENREKAANDSLSGVRAVFCVGPTGISHDIDFYEATSASPEVNAVSLTGSDPFIILYTSGTTGKPKGVPVPVRALAAFHAYMHYGLDLQPDDTFWNISDTAWGYGLWFGVVGALLLGQRMILRNVGFDPADTLNAIGRLGVTNLAGSATAFRSLRAAGASSDFAKETRLRCVSSAGEPLNPELVSWSSSVFGTPIHDHYGQSEVGMVSGFHHHPAVAREVIPGSMGTPLPGFELSIVSDDGAQAPDCEEGEVAVVVPMSPLYWFTGYFREPEKTYLTADTGRRQDGVFFFASRADDVITTSGYRVGPFEVESAVMAHPAVAETAVLGTPDDLRGEVVTAFVVPIDGVSAGDWLVAEIQELVRARLSKHSFPREVVFVPELPRTPSGKVRRNVLRDEWSKGSFASPSTLGKQR
jgi:acetyl-CoA synthetase